VTIITDGLAQSSGFVTSLAAELASAVDDEGRIRLLPVMGYGAEANVRDMLYLRGIDLGILNSDMLSYLEIEGKLPGAKQRLRLVARLFDKRVFVLARSDSTGLAALEGQEVLAAGGDGEARATARTLFALSGIRVSLREQDPETGLAELVAGKAAAMILIARDPDWLRTHVPPAAGLRLLEIPLTQRLAGTYEAASVDPAEAPGLAGPGPVATVRLASVLATFNWRDSQSRYAPVNNLIKALYGIVASVRRSGTEGLWSEILPDADVPGWERYAPSVELARSLPEPAAVPRPAALAAEPRLPPASALPSPFSIAARETPALIGRELQDKGLLVAILAAALAMHGGPEATFDLLSPAGPAGADRPLLPVAREDCQDLESGEIAKPAGCDGFLLSDPVLTVPSVLFARKGSGIAAGSDQDIAGRSLCTVDGADTGRLLGQRRNWQSEQLATFLSMPSLEACFAAVSKGDIDAVLAADPEGRAALAALGIADEIEVIGEPIALTSLAIAIPETMSGAADLVAHINVSLAALESSGRKAEIVAAHLGPLIAQSGTN
jgi:hypothetical protein